MHSMKKTQTGFAILAAIPCINDNATFTANQPSFVAYELNGYP